MNKNNKDQGKISIVSTPIGNMQDMSERAIKVLTDADIIYAEDTRQTAKLLQFFTIKNTVYQLHKHNEVSERESILEHIKNGKNIAIVSDAGTPLISDPGYPVIAFLRENKIRVETVPGCCSVIAALSISGLPTEKFSFVGFLPSKSGQRKEFLADYTDTEFTTVFFETPHRIKSSLADFSEVFSADRKIFIAREMTKKFEDSALLTVGSAKEWLTEDTNRERGEFVIVLDKSEKIKTNNWVKLADLMLKHNIKTKDISKIVSEQSGAPRKEIYNYLISK